MLDLLYRLSHNLYRFRHYFLASGSVLDGDSNSKEAVRAEYGKICGVIHDRSLKTSHFDGFIENIDSSSLKKLIRILVENITGEGVNDFPSGLAECLRVILVERGDYSVEQWRMCFSHLCHVLTV